MSGLLAKLNTDVIDWKKMKGGQKRDKKKKKIVVVNFAEIKLKRKTASMDECLLKIHNDKHAEVIKLQTKNKTATKYTTSKRNPL